MIHAISALTREAEEGARGRSEKLRRRGSEAAPGQGLGRERGLAS
jgi:hypothetical protein